MTITLPENKTDFQQAAELELKDMQPRNRFCLLTGDREVYEVAIKVTNG